MFNSYSHVKQTSRPQSNFQFEYLDFACAVWSEIIKLSLSLFSIEYIWIDWDFTDRNTSSTMIGVSGGNECSTMWNALVKKEVQLRKENLAWDNDEMKLVHKMNIE